MDQNALHPLGNEGRAGHEQIGPDGNRRPSVPKLLIGWTSQDDVYAYAVKSVGLAAACTFTVCGCVHEMPAG
eukprot:204384-Chlamydomonas_euryale.AAC.2